MSTARFAVVDEVTDEETASSGRCTSRSSATLAYDGDALVGFAYGYTGEFGQWWTDNARQALADDVAAAWLGGHFELVSIGVLDGARRAGIGRGLMRAITGGLGHDRLLLMTTSDDADPARRLYASDGWRIIGPGIGEGTVIMGKLPRP